MLDHAPEIYHALPTRLSPVVAAVARNSNAPNGNLPAADTDAAEAAGEAEVVQNLTAAIPLGRNAEAAQMSTKPPRMRPIASERQIM